MPLIMINKKLKPSVNALTMELFKDFYTDAQFNLIKDIFCTYYNRDGVLPFKEFAMIPLTHDPGDITNETGEWAKYIRNKMAHEWNSMKCK